jgi:L-ascorbate metabolism protein UlaG (beta-lactamase superfamily)
MRITRREHACLLVDGAGARLVIDPGAYTTLPTDLTGIAAVVVTHEHQDHATAEQLGRILEGSPDARILGPEGVAAALPDVPVTVVHAGDAVDIGSFRLRFLGGTHAPVHRTVPAVDNLGVLVDDRLYYPGDSFTVPDGTQVEILAVPVGGPWLKLSEAIDFVEAVRPTVAFPTHDAPLSEIGRRSVDARLAATMEALGGSYRPLAPGDAIEV